MAEGWTRYYGGDLVEVDSAGTHPAGVHPHSVWAMNEVGVDISGQNSEALSTKKLEDFDYIITLCGDARDNCPALPQGVTSEHWDLPDPAATKGRPEDIQRAFRIVRYQIEQRVKAFLLEIHAT